MHSRIVQTISGIRFDAWNMRPQDIRLIDIAVGLSNTCRFSGQTPFHYSVAQHSIAMSRMVPEWCKLEALMHDAGEAYLGDVAKPIRNGLADYNGLMGLVESAIAGRFGLVYPWPSWVNVADERMFLTECENFGRNMAGFGMMSSPYVGFKIKRMHPDDVKGEFIDRFVELSKERSMYDPDEEMMLRRSDD